MAFQLQSRPVKVAFGGVTSLKSYALPLLARYPDRPQRNDARANFSDHTRIELSEQDADQNERDHAALQREIASLKKLLIGIFMSTATAAVGLYVNLIAGTLGGK